MSRNFYTRNLYAVFVCLFFAAFFLVSSFSSVDAQCACCAGAGMGASGDPSISFSQPFKKQWSAEGTLDYRTVQESSMHHQGMAMSETPLHSLLVNSLALRYGITERFAVSVQQPFVFIQTALGNDKGLGDMQVTGSYRLIRNKRLNMSLHAGIELPIGVQKAARFEQSTAVIGSGSFDPILGLSLAYKLNRLGFAGSAFFKKTTAGFQNNNYGSSALQSLLVSYSLLGYKADCSADSVQSKKQPGLTIHAAYIGEWLDKLVEDDVVDEDSGYYIGYVSGGATASYGRWSMPLNIAFPLICNMNGMQNNPGFRVRCSVIYSF